MAGSGIPSGNDSFRWRRGAGWAAAFAAVLLTAPALGPVAAAPAARPGWLDKAAAPLGAGQDRAPAFGRGGSPLRIRGAVGSSMYRSARAAGVAAGAIQQTLAALDRRQGLDDLLPSDSFDLVVATRASAAAAAGEVLYAAVERDGRPQVQLLRWGKDGALQAPEEIVRAAGSGWLPPVAGRITSAFGLRRHPLLGFVRRHAGIDIAAAYGTPVRATAAGMVTFAGWHGGHGNFIRLAHSAILGSGYAHLSRLAVAPGMEVRAGQVIGYVGSTGLSTGAHLHYELYRDGRAVDPRRALAAPGGDPGEAAAVQARLAVLLRVRVSNSAKSGTSPLPRPTSQTAYP